MKKYLAIFLTMSLLFAGCIKKEDYDSDRFTKTSWNPQVGFPLIKSVMGVKNLMGNIDSNVVTSDLNGLVVLKYKSLEQLIKASEFITFPDNIFLKSPISLPLNIPGTFPVIIPFDTSAGVRFSKIIIESGSLEISFDVNSNKGNQANFNFQSIKNSGGSNLIMAVSIEPNRKEIRDLANHSILINAQGDFVFDITIPSGLSGVANPVIQFKNLVFKRIEGDFGSAQFTLPVDSFRLHIFRKLASQGELYVDNPIINLDVNNGFGMPLALDLSSLAGVNTISGTTTTVVKPGQGVFNIAQGTGAFPVLSSIRLDKTNSNLNTVMQPTPIYIRYGLGVEANPGRTGKNFNSLDSDAAIAISTTLELPLSGRIKGLAIVDTVPFTVNESFDLVNDMTLSTAIKNGFPFTIRLSILLLDENYNTVLTERGDAVYLLNDREIATSGTVNSGTGKVDQNNLETKLNNYVIGNAETKELLKGKFVRIEGRIETYNNGNDIIGIYDNYIFDLRVGVKITGNLTF